MEFNIYAISNKNNIIGSSIWYKKLITKIKIFAKLFEMIFLKNTGNFVIVKGKYEFTNYMDEILKSTNPKKWEK